MMDVAQVELSHYGVIWCNKMCANTDVKCFNKFLPVWNNWILAVEFHDQVQCISVMFEFQNIIFTTFFLMK